jgi:uncharacterized protein
MDTQHEKNNLFPVFLKMEQLKLLIVGGGKVGLEKLNAVLHNSPATRISLVALKINSEIRRLTIEFPYITLHERAFQVEDLEEKDIVIVAVDDKIVSKQIHEAAKSYKKLVNVADTPDLCDFYLGSIVQKGNLKLGISTNGKSPTIAKRLKEVLSEVLPDELDEILKNMNLIRDSLKGNFEEKVFQLNELTKGLVVKADKVEKAEEVERAEEVEKVIMIRD